MISKIYIALVYGIFSESEALISPSGAGLSVFLSVVKNPFGLILPSWTELFIV